MEFITDVYEFSHGHLPRGRGSWAFSTDKAGRCIYWMPSNLTYAEAKKAMRARAKALSAAERPITAVYVCP